MKYRKLVRVAFALSVLLLLNACSSRPNNVLSSSEMTEFLVDLHRLDGALLAKGLGDTQDSVNAAYYKVLLKKHGISKADFDSSLVWYAKNPKKFERIYFDVVNELTVLNEKVKQGHFHPQDSVRLRNIHDSIWPLAQRKFVFNKDSVPSKIQFAVKNRTFVYQDVYVLSFLHRVGKSNKAKKQHAIIRLHYQNGTRDSIVSSLISDSLLRRYTVRLKARRPLRIDSISGALLNFDAKKNQFNGFVDSVKLVRIYNSLAQDSLLKVVFEANKPKVSSKMPTEK